jgi:transcriptional regulator with XRE-family HTH domain
MQRQRAQLPHGARQIPQIPQEVVMPQRLVVTELSHEPRKRFAEEVRRLRVERGLSLRDLSKAVGWDSSLFGKMESGNTLGGPEVVQALDQYYGTGPLLLTLWELALGDPTQFKEQYRRYMVLEAEATSLWQYSVSACLVCFRRTGTREALAGWLPRQGAGPAGRSAHRSAEVAGGLRTRRRSAPPLRSGAAHAPTDKQAWRQQLEFWQRRRSARTSPSTSCRSASGLHGLVSTDVMFLRLLDGTYRGLHRERRAWRTHRGKCPG